MGELKTMSSNYAHGLALLVVCASASVAAGPPVRRARPALLPASQPRYVAPLSLLVEPLKAKDGTFDEFRLKLVNRSTRPVDADQSWGMGVAVFFEQVPEPVRQGSTDPYLGLDQMTKLRPDASLATTMKWSWLIRPMPAPTDLRVRFAYDTGGLVQMASMHGVTLRKISVYSGWWKLPADPKLRPVRCPTAAERLSLTSLLPPWSLVGTVDASGRPSVTLVGSGRAPTSEIRTLRGKVRIVAPEQALEYVRLFSSLDTHYLFRSDVVEASEGFGFAKVPPYLCGRLNLKAPRVRRIGQRFEIERLLAVYPARYMDPPKLIRSLEYVDEDGAYLRLEGMTYDDPDVRDSLHLPYYSL